ncbi:MAG: bifunctional riboflavin kinase/FAD synthetase [Thermoleophilaceae bacterium]|nr:bifunctional riboflavin kinase/FAD synthetase [Thermoleophilaceae bacterium]
MSIQTLRIDQVEPRPRRVAIGVFDGVHMGHRKVIEGSQTVLTFDPHPLYVLRHDAAPKMLTPLVLKARLLEQIGVEELVLIEFNKDFAQMSAEHFVRKILIEQLGATHVSVGENFRFGTRAQGDPAYLAQFEEFETSVVPLVESGGEIVSSTQVRGLIAAGEVARADELLGYPFTMIGEIIHGDKRGRELGFPTANLAPDEHDCVPGHGVYAALTNGVPSAVNVGVRPTFQTGRGVLVESFLIDWSGDLYGQTAEIQFLQRLRGEKRFDGAQPLIEQMHKDVAQAVDICASRSL